MLNIRMLWAVVGVVLAGLMVLAFQMAQDLAGSGLLNPVPPGGAEPDLPATGIVTLYQLAFTAWVMLFLLIPAYATVWVRDSSPLLWHFWLAHWTASWIAFAIHIYVTAALYFEGDIAAMAASTRVGAFWPVMILLVWWPLDIALQLSGRKATWIWAQGVALQGVVFVMFVVGAAILGETIFVRALGLCLLIAGLGSGVFVWHMSRAS